LTSEDECVDVSMHANIRKKLSSGRQLPKPRILDSSDSEDSEAEETKSLIDSGSEQDIENRAFSPRTRNIYY
jgi:hypothetical protein